MPLKISVSDLVEAQGPPLRIAFGNPKGLGEKVDDL